MNEFFISTDSVRSHIIGRQGKRNINDFSAIYRMKRKSRWIGGTKKNREAELRDLAEDFHFSNRTGTGS